MNDKFFQLLCTFLLQHGVAILDDRSRLSALLKDYARNDFDREIRLLLQAVTLGCHTKILASTDIDATASLLINQLRAEFFSEEASWYVVAILCRLLQNHEIAPLPAHVVLPSKPGTAQPVRGTTSGSSPLDKKAAIQIVNSHRHSFLNRNNTIFSNIIDTVTGSRWWFEPDNSRFRNDFHLILNNHSHRKLHYFCIPAGRIQNARIVFYQRPDFDNKSSITIAVDDPTFTDIKEGFSFAPYLKETIHY